MMIILITCLEPLLISFNRYIPTSVLMCLNVGNALLLLQHEDASVDMFRHIVEKNDLKNIKFKDNQLDIYQLGDQDMLFIEELFAGPKKKNIEQVTQFNILRVVLSSMFFYLY